MYRRKYDGCPFGLDRCPTRFQDAERPTQKSLRRCGAEANNDLRLHERDLVLQPRKTRSNLSGVRSLVQTTRASRIASPLEMLHGVRDVDVVSIDGRRIERAVEQLAGRPDEGMSGFVFRVAGLLTHNHHAGARRSFAEDSLRPELEEMTSATAVRRGTKLRQRRVRRNEISGGAGWTRCFSRLRHAAGGLRANGAGPRWADRRRQCRSALVVSPRTLRFRRAFREDLR